MATEKASTQSASMINSGFVLSGMMVTLWTWRLRIITEGPDGRKQDEFSQTHTRRVGDPSRGDSEGRIPAPHAHHRLRARQSPWCKASVHQRHCLEEARYQR